MEIEEWNYSKSVEKVKGLIPENNNLASTTFHQILDIRSKLPLYKWKKLCKEMIQEMTGRINNKSYRLTEAWLREMAFWEMEKNGPPPLLFKVHNPKVEAAEGLILKTLNL